MLFFTPREELRQDLGDDSFEALLDGRQRIRFGQLNLSCRDDERVLDAHLGAFGGVDLVAAGAGGFGAGDGAGWSWSLEECATWSRDHDFDCVRLADSGAQDSDRILEQGPDEVRETLSAHGLYLACISSHCNLLDDDREAGLNEQKRLIKAVPSAAALEWPVGITGSGSPVKNGQFYGMYSSSPGNPGDRSDELVERFREMFTPVVAVAADLDIRIALDVAVRMGNIGCNPEMWEKILDAVPSEHLGLSCDPSHWL